MLKKVVNATEVVALVAALTFVVLLFAYRPAGPGGAATSVAGDRVAAGDAIFRTNCSACHGAAGEGSIGPKLAGGAVVRKFPEIADQIALVSNGRGIMPAWSGRLSSDEIEAVVRYTRDGL